MSTVNVNAKFMQDYIRAGSVEASESELRQLASSPDHRVRMRVAENSSAPADVLTRLAGDSSAEVRIAVAANSRTPLSTVLDLATDDDEYVRIGLAQEISTPVAVLSLLEQDDNPYIAIEAGRTLRIVNETRAPAGRANLRLISNRNCIATANPASNQAVMASSN
ncbi:MAG: hypothetical protein AB7W16_12555 [Candidatus Obscuribacterales bacterium]